MTDRNFKRQRYNLVITFKHIAGEQLADLHRQSSTAKFALLYKRENKYENEGETFAAECINGQVTWNHTVSMHCTSTKDKGTGEKQKKIMRVALIMHVSTSSRCVGEIFIDLGKYMTGSALQKDFWYPMPLATKLHIRLCASPLGLMVDRDDPTDMTATTIASESFDEVTTTLDARSRSGSVKHPKEEEQENFGSILQESDRGYDTRDSTSAAPLSHSSSRGRSVSDTEHIQSEQNKKVVIPSLHLVSDYQSYPSANEDDELGHKLQKLLRARDAERLKRRIVTATPRQKAVQLSERRQLLDRIAKEESMYLKDLQEAEELECANKELESLCQTSRLLLAQEKMRSKLPREINGRKENGESYCNRGCGTAVAQCSMS